MSRNALRTPAALLVVLAAIGCSQQQSGPEPTTGIRNLLLVCFDTVRFDSFRTAATNDPRDPQGNWKVRALRFGNALAPAPWTVPSVASILTGRDPVRHGAGVFASPIANLDKEIPSPISPDVATLAERLSEEGFETAAFVAHPWFESRYGLERGFESLTLETKRRRLAGMASAWLNWHTSSDDPRRFFLYLHFMDSHRHLRWTPQERHRRENFLHPKSAERALANAPGGVCDDRNAESCSQYLAYVRSIAEQLESLATVLKTLEESGQADDTVVILYSDHGEEFNDHGALERERGVDPRGIYGLGHGQSLYQELLHVPLWIWHPDLEGREVLGVVSLLDVMPTALDWLGLDGGAALDGRSLAAWLAGSAPAPEVDRPLFATRIAYGPEQASLIRLPWKRISHYSGDGELYDLLEDPRESDSRDEPAVAPELDAQIAAWLGRESPALANPPALSQEQIERLQALGYLEGVAPETDD